MEVLTEYWNQKSIPIVSSLAAFGYARLFNRSVPYYKKLFYKRSI